MRQCWIHLLWIFIVVLYEFFIKCKLDFSAFKTIHRQFFQHFPFIKVADTPVHEIQGFCTKIIVFHVFVVICCWLFHINELRDTYRFRYLSLPLAAYQRLSAIQIQHLSSSDTLAILILVLTKITQDQVYVFSYISYISFWIHLPLTICHSARIDRDTHQHFVFLNPPDPFCVFCNQYLWCLPLPDYYKILSFLAMMFHWIFTNCPCTHMDKHLSATSHKNC